MNLYEELRYVHEAISKVNLKENDDVVKAKEDLLLRLLRRLLELSNIVRKEGLLALEEAVINEKSVPVEDLLRQLIILVVDGTDASDVRKIGWSRYYSSLVKDYEALNYLLCIEGALSIQAGENQRVLEEKLKMMLPNSLYLNYCKEQEKELEEEMRESSENMVEQLCSAKKFWNPNDKGYFVMKLADYVFSDVEDKALERLLREISNDKLALAMKGLGGEARRHIFSNLSERLGKLMAEHMVYMGPVCSKWVVEALQDIMLRLIDLIEQGEIADRYQYLAPFYDVLCVDSEKEVKKLGKLYDLKRLLTEYEEMEESKVE